ncbi:uncharacterized protein V6R79_013516 [Siganus canaliculatus]
MWRGVTNRKKKLRRIDQPLSVTTGQTRSGRSRSRAAGDQAKSQAPVRIHGLKHMSDVTGTDSSSGQVDRCRGREPSHAKTRRVESPPRRRANFTRRGRIMT